MKLINNELIEYVRFVSMSATKMAPDRTGLIFRNIETNGEIVNFDWRNSLTDWIPVSNLSLDTFFNLPMFIEQRVLYLNMLRQGKTFDMDALDIVSDLGFLQTRRRKTRKRKSQKKRKTNKGRIYFPTCKK